MSKIGIVWQLRRGGNHIMKRLFLSSAALLASLGLADAATTNLSIVINSGPSTSVSCPLQPSYTAPLAANTVLCPITVLPATWSGALTLSGTNANLFAIVGTNFQVGSSPITQPGTYTVTITATP